MRADILRRAVRLAFAPALALCLAGPVAAAGSSAGSSAKAGAEGQQERSVRAEKASELIGRHVVDAQRRKLGEIEDFVVDMRNGELRYAAVSFTEMAEGRGRIYAVPVGRFRAMPSGDTVVLDIAPSQLSGMKSWDKGSWRAAMEPRGLDERADDSGQRVGASTGGSTLVRASRLIGQDVVNRQEDKLGKLQDLVIGLERQRVHYAVLEFDPGLLSRGELFPFAVSRFSIEREDRGRPERLVLNVDDTRLSALEGMPRDNWPLIRERTGNDLDRYLSRFEEGEQSRNASFDSLDLNRDGYLSRNEAQGDRDAAKRWSLLDRNRDDRISRYEFDRRE